MVMYGVYIAKALEKLIKTVHQVHNTTTPNVRLFTGELNTAFTWYVSKNGAHHCAINSLLYLRTLREKYVEMYEEFILQMQLYAKAIQILAIGYLPICLISPLKLQEILASVQITIWKTNPGYDLVIKGLNLYYDMKLVILVLTETKI